MLIEIIFGIISLIFLFYFILFIISADRIKLSSNTEEQCIKKIPVIIPASNEELVIEETLDALLNKNKDMISEIVIAINNSDDKTMNICTKYAKKYSFIKIIEIKGEVSSKVRAVLSAIKNLKDKYFAILDADTVLKEGAIKKLYLEIIKSKREIITGIIDPFPRKGLQYNILSWDRIFRQRILQAGKSLFGMANFPGCFAIVNTKKYKHFIKDHLMEDYDLTLCLFRKGKSIQFIPSTVACEQEKTSFVKLFFQRVRWTRGNIIISNQWIKTFFKINPLKKMIFITYPLFWYIFYYYLAVLFLGSLLTQNRFFLINYLLIAGMFYFTLLYAKIKFRDLQLLDTLTGICFIVLFPLIMIIALLYTVLGIILKPNNNMFSKGKYFRR